MDKDLKRLYRSRHAGGKHIKSAQKNLLPGRMNHGMRFGLPGGISYLIHSLELILMTILVTRAGEIIPVQPHILKPFKNQL